MSQFRFTCRNSYAERYTEVQLEAETLDEVIENFEEFLRGCGYYFNGTLQIVPDEEQQVPGWHREWVPDTETAWNDDADVPVIHVQDTEGGIE